MFSSRAAKGELLLGLPYLRNLFFFRRDPDVVNYYLVYRTSETQVEG